MREQNEGVIINTASIAGVRPRTGLSAYAPSKGAVITLTKQAAHELADDGIRVNAICPVAANTPMLSDFAGDLSEQDVEEQVLNTIPLGRLCEPEDVAEAVSYLASSSADLVTGVALEVDGGRSL